MHLKLGFSTCPNDTYIFEALVNKRIDSAEIELDCHLADVEELNKLTLNSQLDFSKISIAVYPKIEKDYMILNSGAALGNNNGPIVISKYPVLPEDIKNLKIAIPGMNTTANLLLSIAFPKAQNKIEYLFSDIEDAVLSGETDIGLIIHESRFTFQGKGLKKVVDLGEYWEQQYKHLVPLGCIVAKRSLPLETIQLMNKLISKSILYAYAHPVEAMPYIKMHARELSDDVINKHIDLYVNKYSIHLGRKGHEAIKFLFSRASQSEILPMPVNKIFL
jgi:1,4-dihydroxy-6-naphthoate synthase